MTQKIAYVTRIESFSSCHRLHCRELSDEENVKIFGKCNNPNGHGHNYKIEVTIRGTIDSMTGMVMNISELKKIIKDKILDVLDHKNIDLDVDYFKSRTSTAENIAQFAFDQINCHTFPENVLLHSIKLHETDKNVVEIINHDM